MISYVISYREIHYLSKSSTLDAPVTIPELCTRIHDIIVKLYDIMYDVIYNRKDITWRSNIATVGS